MPRRLSVLAVIGLFGTAFAAVGPATYQLIAQIRISGEGGWDYLSIDATARRLYIAHGDRVEVLDIDHNRLLGSIGETPGVHGFALAPELRRGFASDGQTSEVSVVDLDKLTTLARVHTGTGPDAITFNPRHNEVYTFNGHGNSSTVIDAQSNKVVATLALPGRPEFAVVDPSADRIYANIVDSNLLIAIDGHSHRIVALWQLAPCQNPTGLAIDTAHHRLFVGCRNQKMLMVDSRSGAVLAIVPIGREVDATVFDPQTQRVFSSNGDGTLSIAHEDAPDRMSLVETLKTQPGARTMALDTTTHRLYLVTADPASAGQSTAAPGSFRVLVYAP
jgi:YVTN family beta-propeller protein